LVPIKEIETSVEDQHMALQARLIGKAMRKIQSTLLKERMRGHEVTVLLVNQWRTNIGQMFGDPRVIPGGKAAEYFPSLIWVMKNKEKVGKDEQFDVETVVENEHAFQIIKWRGNNGPRSGEFRVSRVERPDQFLHEGSIDDAKTVLAYAKKFGCFTGGGSSWSLEFANYSYKLRGSTEGELLLNEHRDVYTHLCNWVIREQAKHLGMPTDFLASFDVGEEAPVRRRRKT